MQDPGTVRRPASLLRDGVQVLRATAVALAAGPILAAALITAPPAAALSTRADALPGETAALPRPPARSTAKPKPRRPIAPWFFGRGGEPRIVPPRSIPTGRPSRAGTETPLPTARPRSGPAETTGTTRPKRPMPPRAPGAIDVPIAPLN